ncbi:hypothetical protein IOZ78_003638 [Salmonella enterica]|nr:hypothetical protein [Salmonella enterica]EDU6025851.1 hypothetical protein [Salmonella enterica subsp. enterica serovar Brazil]EBH5054845.1 hypothetical protein [Salmonella enterica]EBN7764713.1 hypothetical protein [Salmonella enterica]EBO9548300.1 hypothetical protein [Salmonella enterica]
MQNNITGKVIVITGASSDLSEAIALFLASQYAKIVLAALHAERMNAFAKDILQILFAIYPPPTATPE